MYEVLAEMFEIDKHHANIFDMDLVTEMIMRLKQKDMEQARAGLRKREEKDNVKKQRSIWLSLINDTVDKMAIIELRRICQNADRNEIPGKVLLQYRKYGVLKRLPKRFKHFKWAEYIEKYKRDPDSYKPQTSTVIRKQFNQQQQVRRTLNILQQYDEIINGWSKHDELNVDQLQRLFNLINEEFNMSEIMDTFLNLKHGAAKYLN
eukprot:446923_1